MAATYWDSNKRKSCPVLDDSKGITLRSLGGIFLATLCGLLLSLVTLAYEMWQQKREEKKLVGPDSQQNLDSSDQAKPISTLDKEVLGTAINVNPRFIF